jgi:alkanesulfonate monooxygenase SsuD/methylene tetrahydromethanopterin reductase-like flavin-dependent oxidoreductase (luciferase family)
VRPGVTLAAVAVSDRLAVQTVVMNSAWVHPGLLMRSFAQLAVLLGGERVTAGLGAGWSAEEFDALGLAMPKFRTRIDRLAEVLAVARGLFTDGAVTHEGAHVVTRDLPLSHVPDRPPRLLVGGPGTPSGWRPRSGTPRSVRLPRSAPRRRSCAPRGRGSCTARWTAARTSCSAARRRWPRHWPSGARPTG